MERREGKKGKTESRRVNESELGRRDPTNQKEPRTITRTFRVCGSDLDQKVQTTNKQKIKLSLACVPCTCLSFLRSFLIHTASCFLSPKQNSCISIITCTYRNDTTTTKKQSYQINPSIKDHIGPQPPNHSPSIHRSIDRFQALVP